MTLMLTPLTLFTRPLRRSFASAVKIVEVGPRDGLQNEQKMLSTAIKFEFIKKLRAAGLETIEAGSFVSPKWVPQMANSEDLIKMLAADTDTSAPCSYPVLIPNLQGFHRFLKASQDGAALKEISVFTSASEGFSRKNTNCSIADSLERIKAVTEEALKRGIRVRGYVSNVIKCPFDGPTAPESVLDVSQRLLNAGCYEISLGDTTGVGRPDDFERLLEAILAKISPQQLAVHCHDTYGQALANIYRSLQMGIRTVDASCAGLGGCPFAPGASGNVATEDLVYLLQGDSGKWDCGGVDLAKLIEAGDFITSALGIPNRSKVSQATLKGR